MRVFNPDQNIVQEINDDIDGKPSKRELIWRARHWVWGFSIDFWTDVRNWFRKRQRQ